MKRFLFGAVALAAALSFPMSSAVGGEGGNGGYHPTLQKCDTSGDATYFTEFGIGGATINGSDPQNAQDIAWEALHNALAVWAQIECGPCPIPDSCKAKAEFLGDDFTITGPTLGSNGRWRYSVLYKGKYRINCGKC